MTKRLDEPLFQTKSVWFFFFLLSATKFTTLCIDVKTFCCAPEKLKFKITTARYCKFIHIVSTVAYQAKVAHQYPPPHLCLFLSLIRSPTKQLCSKVDNSRMYWYKKTVFTSIFFYPVHILDDSHHPPPFVYELNSCLFLNQKIYKDIRISYSLKYKHSKK